MGVSALAPISAKSSVTTAGRRPAKEPGHYGHPLQFARRSVVPGQKSSDTLAMRIEGKGVPRSEDVKDLPWGAEGKGVLAGDVKSFTARKKDG